MGVRSDASAVSALGERGMGGIGTDEGLHCLERLLNARTTQTSVIPVNWQKWAERYPAYMEKPFLSKLALELTVSHSDQGEAASRAESRKKSSALLDQLASAAEANRLGILREHVRAAAVRVLGFSADRHIDPNLPLNGFGLDSLMALEFRNMLSRDVGRPLPATLLFSYPAIEDVASYVARLLYGAAIHESAAASSGPSQDVLENIEEISDEEVERRLAMEREVTR